jgi:response regulator RpfG family c-di-GMP phosphodiesterase
MEEYIHKKQQARVLIVDDEHLIRKMLVKYLSEKDYIVESADNGQTALDKLSEVPYDLVLTDLNMPNMGGRELLQRMAELYPDLPKIVMTGFGTNDDIILALKTGAYDFLTKPINDLTILEHSIERAIERKLLNDEKNRYIEQLKQINDVISMLNRGKSTEEVFDTLNVELKKFIPFNRLALTFIDQDSGLAVTKLVASDRDVLLKANDSFNMNESSLRKVAVSGNFLNIPSLKAYYDNHSESTSTRLLLEEGMLSSLVLPLIVNNIVRGFLMFASIEESAFDDEHIRFLESIVGQISLSVQRGELLFEIEQHTKNLEHIVDIRTREIVKTQKTTIFALSRLAETRDPETGEHLERIRNYSALMSQILKYMGTHSEISNQYLRDLYDSSILHDIGKVGIPDGILLKEAYLSPDEFEIMKKHTTIGYDALKSASKDLGENSFLVMAMQITRSHHERWDGLGYPDGLKAAEIPLAARIVSIADVYDALTSRRPYKEEFSHDKSIEIMKEESHRFDPELFKIFIDNSDEFNNIRLKYNDYRTR